MHDEKLIQTLLTLSVLSNTLAQKIQETNPDNETDIHHYIAISTVSKLLAEKESNSHSL